MQITTVYIISSELLARLERLALGQDHQRFWEALAPYEVKPERPCLGYFWSFVRSFLGEHGIMLPLNIQDANAKSVFENEYAVVLCVGKGDAASTLASLNTLTPSKQELRLFFEAFGVKEDWNEASVELLELLAFLRWALLQLHTEGDWLLVFVG